MHIVHLPVSQASADTRQDRHQRPLALPSSPTLSEIFAGNGNDAGAVGFALAQVAGGESSKNRPLLWIQDRMSILQTGRPFPPGLPYGFDAHLIHVEARDAKAALWAMEEGLRCSALSAVVGEIWGDPRALDFVATRRLAVASERGGVPAILLLFDAAPNLSGARMRWHAASRPSLPHRWDDRAPGPPVWSLDLFKARGVDPGRWDVAHEADGLHPLSPAGDGQSGQEETAKRA